PPLPPHKNVTSPASPLPPPSAAAPSQLLIIQPPVLDYTDCGPGTPLLLTDGTVMLADKGCQDWWKLTPDQFGSYVNGRWTQLASLPAGYSPLYHSSAVLPDGRVIIEGGEYNFLKAVWTNMGAIYDPGTNNWTMVKPPAGWSTIGDAQSVVLANGTYMQANCCTTQSALLDPATLAWASTGANKFDVYDEEGWTLLPNGKVLTVDAYVPIGITYMPTDTNSEIYDVATGSWSSAGGIVLLIASPLACITPASFLEWDGTSLTQAPPAPNASNDSSFYGNFLVLPTGQILFTDFFFVSVYNPVRTYNLAWPPVIKSAPSVIRPGGSYVVSGYRFNGMSQASAYGDDFQSATNYPLVRITNNRTGHV